MNNASNLLQKLNFKLFELLSGLSWEQWNKNTSFKHLKVKDIAIQLLDESRHDLFQLSNDPNHVVEIISNDNFNGEVFLLNLKIVQDEWNNYLNQDFRDISKIYAKNWLLQQQIRVSIAASLLLESNFYEPFLDYCLRFLPAHFESVCPPNNTIISIFIVAEPNMKWQLIHIEQAWEFTKNQDYPDTQVYIDQNIAWILFSGGVDIYEASQYWQVIGNQELGRHVLSMRPFEIGL
jgi:hypothetical protein